ncbi:hypothetical protein [Paraburkholderia sp. RL18-085-BIA-A]|uniref:hypothetical protein n=1 Tax=Paraburkholderia sp. RL18-085-BIA-A TaxID=3031633 RepID=UPI0038BC7E4F
MQASQIPVKFPLPFAADAQSGYIRPIPTQSQILTSPGAASLTDGFPPLTFIPEGAGGTPPFGKDMNGILNQITAWIQWANAGGPVTYDAAFSASIGGYPKGAYLTSASGGSWWVSIVDNNTTNPDAGGAGWAPFSFLQSYAGNPNGNVAGHAGVPGQSAPSLIWDTTDTVLWVCKTTGTSSTAVWTPVTGPLSGLGIGAGLFNDGSGNLAATVGAVYVNSSITIAPGSYLVDTSAGPLTLTLPATPSKTPFTFIDATASWGSTPWTLARNGNTIMGQASDLIVNVADQQFTAWFNGSDWRLV